MPLFSLWQPFGAIAPLEFALGGSHNVVGLTGGWRSRCPRRVLRSSAAARGSCVARWTLGTGRGSLSQRYISRRGSSSTSSTRTRRTAHTSWQQKQPGRAAASGLGGGQEKSRGNSSPDRSDSQRHPGMRRRTEEGERVAGWLAAAPEEEGRHD